MAAPGRALPSAARSKWDIREEVWEHLEASGLAEFPRPVRGRIPNFKVPGRPLLLLLPCPALPGAALSAPQCPPSSPPVLPVPSQISSVPP